MAKDTGSIGDGASTVFDVDVGFGTSGAIAKLIDTFAGDAAVLGFGFQRATPNATSVRITLTPAPALNQITYSVTDGTEKP